METYNGNNKEKRLHKRYDTGSQNRSKTRISLKKKLFKTFTITMALIVSILQPVETLMLHKNDSSASGGNVKLVLGTSILHQSGYDQPFIDKFKLSADTDFGIFFYNVTKDKPQTFTISNCMSNDCKNVDTLTSSNIKYITRYDNVELTFNDIDTNDIIEYEVIKTDKAINKDNPKLLRNLLKTKSGSDFEKLLEYVDPLKYNLSGTDRYMFDNSEYWNLGLWKEELLNVNGIINDDENTDRKLLLPYFIKSKPVSTVTLIDRERNLNDMYMGSYTSGLINSVNFQSMENKRFFILPIDRNIVKNGGENFFQKKLKNNENIEYKYYIEGNNNNLYENNLYKNINDNNVFINHNLTFKKENNAGVIYFFRKLFNIENNNYTSYRPIGFSFNNVTKSDDFTFNNSAIEGSTNKDKVLFVFKEKEGEEPIPYNVIKTDIDKTKFIKYKKELNDLGYRIKLDKNALFTKSPDEYNYYFSEVPIPNNKSYTIEVADGYKINKIEIDNKLKYDTFKDIPRNLYTGNKNIIYEIERSKAYLGSQKITISNNQSDYYDADIRDYIYFKILKDKDYVFEDILKEYLNSVELESSKVRFMMNYITNFKNGYFKAAKDEYYNASSYGDIKPLNDCGNESDPTNSIICYQLAASYNHRYSSAYCSNGNTVVYQEVPCQTRKTKQQLQDEFNNYYEKFKAKKWIPWIYPQFMAHGDTELSDLLDKYYEMYEYFGSGDKDIYLRTHLVPYKKLRIYSIHGTNHYSYNNHGYNNARNYLSVDNNMTINNLQDFLYYYIYHSNSNSYAYSSGAHAIKFNKSNISSFYYSSPGYMHSFASPITPNRVKRHYCNYAGNYNTLILSNLDYRIEDLNFCKPLNIINSNEMDTTHASNYQTKITNYYTNLYRGYDNNSYSAISNYNLVSALNLSKHKVVFNESTGNIDIETDYADTDDPNLDNINTEQLSPYNYKKIKTDKELKISTKLRLKSAKITLYPFKINVYTKNSSKPIMSVDGLDFINDRRLTIPNFTGEENEYFIEVKTQAVPNNFTLFTQDGQIPDVSDALGEAYPEDMHYTPFEKLEQISETPFADNKIEMNSENRARFAESFVLEKVTSSEPTKLKVKLTKIDDGYVKINPTKQENEKSQIIDITSTPTKNKLDKTSLEIDYSEVNSENTKGRLFIELQDKVTLKPVFREQINKSSESEVNLEEILPKKINFTKYNFYIYVINAPKYELEETITSTNYTGTIKYKYDTTLPNIIKKDTASLPYEQSDNKMFELKVNKEKETYGVTLESYSTDQLLEKLFTPMITFLYHGNFPVTSTSSFYETLISGRVGDKLYISNSIEDLSVGGGTGQPQESEAERERKRQIQLAMVKINNGSAALVDFMTGHVTGVSKENLKHIKKAIAKAKELKGSDLTYEEVLKEVADYLVSEQLVDTNLKSIEVLDQTVPLDKTLKKKIVYETGSAPKPQINFDLWKRPTVGDPVKVTTKLSDQDAEEISFDISEEDKNLKHIILPQPNPNYKFTNMKDMVIVEYNPQPNNLTKITGNVTWSIRPDHLQKLKEQNTEVSIVVKGTDGTVRLVDLKKENSETYEINNLPHYTTNGEVIQYTLFFSSKDVTLKGDFDVSNHKDLTITKITEPAPTFLQYPLLVNSDDTIDVNLKGSSGIVKSVQVNRSNNTLKFDDVTVIGPDGEKIQYIIELTNKDKYKLYNIDGRIVISDAPKFNLPIQIDWKRGSENNTQQVNLQLERTKPSESPTVVTSKIVQISDTTHTFENLYGTLSEYKIKCVNPNVVIDGFKVTVKPEVEPPAVLSPEEEQKIQARIQALAKINAVTKQTQTNSYPKAKDFFTAGVAGVSDQMVADVFNLILLKKDLNSNANLTAEEIQELVNQYNKSKLIEQSNNVSDNVLDLIQQPVQNKIIKSIIYKDIETIKQPQIRFNLMKKTGVGEDQVVTSKTISKNATKVEFDVTSSGSEQYYIKPEPMVGFKFSNMKEYILVTKAEIEIPTMDIGIKINYNMEDQDFNRISSSLDKLTVYITGDNGTIKAVDLRKEKNETHKISKFPKMKVIDDALQNMPRKVTFHSDNRDILVNITKEASATIGEEDYLVTLTLYKAPPSSSQPSAEEQERQRKKVVAINKINNLTISTLKSEYPSAQDFHDADVFGVAPNNIDKLVKFIINKKDKNSGALTSIDIQSVVNEFNKFNEPITHQGQIGTDDIIQDITPGQPNNYRLVKDIVYDLPVGTEKPNLTFNLFARNKADMETESLQEKTILDGSNKVEFIIPVVSTEKDYYIVVQNVRGYKITNMRNSILVEKGTLIPKETNYTVNISYLMTDDDYNKYKQDINGTTLILKGNDGSARVEALNKEKNVVKVIRNVPVEKVNGESLLPITYTIELLTNNKRLSYEVENVSTPGNITYNLKLKYLPEQSTENQLNVELCKKYPLHDDRCNTINNYEKLVTKYCKDNPLDSDKCRQQEKYQENAERYCKNNPMNEDCKLKNILSNEELNKLKSKYCKKYKDTDERCSSVTIESDPEPFCKNSNKSNACYKGFCKNYPTAPECVKAVEYCNEHPADSLCFIIKEDGSAHPSPKDGLATKWYCDKKENKSKEECTAGSKFCEQNPSYDSCQTLAPIEEISVSFPFEVKLKKDTDYVRIRLMKNGNPTDQITRISNLDKIAKFNNLAKFDENNKLIKYSAKIEDMQYYELKFDKVEGKVGKHLIVTEKENITKPSNLFIKVKWNKMAPDRAVIILKGNNKIDKISVNKLINNYVSEVFSTDDFVNTTLVLDKENGYRMPIGSITKLDGGYEVTINDEQPTEEEKKPVKIKVVWNVKTKDKVKLEIGLFDDDNKKVIELSETKTIELKEFTKKSLNKLVAKFIDENNKKVKGTIIKDNEGLIITVNEVKDNKQDSENKSLVKLTFDWKVESPEEVKLLISLDNNTRFIETIRKGTKDLVINNTLSNINKVKISTITDGAELIVNKVDSGYNIIISKKAVKPNDNPQNDNPQKPEQPNTGQQQKPNKEEGLSTDKNIKPDNYNESLVRGKMDWELKDRGVYVIINYLDKGEVKEKKIANHHTWFSLGKDVNPNTVDIMVMTPASYNKKVKVSREVSREQLSNGKTQFTVTIKVSEDKQNIIINEKETKFKGTVEWKVIDKDIKLRVYLTKGDEIKETLTVENISNNYEFNKVISNKEDISNYKISASILKPVGLEQLIKVIPKQNKTNGYDFIVYIETKGSDGGTYKIIQGKTVEVKTSNDNKNDGQAVDPDIINDRVVVSGRIYYTFHDKAPDFDIVVKGTNGFVGRYKVNGFDKKYTIKDPNGTVTDKYSIELEGNNLKSKYQFTIGSNGTIFVVKK